MLAKIFVMFVKPNLPHLLGIFVYGLIAITLAIIAYKIFSSLIPLKIGFESNPTETLAAAILACGIMIGVGLIVAIGAYQPDVPVYPSTIALVSREGGADLSSCGSCAIKKDANKGQPPEGGAAPKPKNANDKQ